MSKKTIATLAFVGGAIVCWLLGVLFLVLRGNSQKKFELQKQACTNETTATIIQMDKRRIKRGDAHSYCWFPTYEYYVDGVRYVKESSVGEDKKLFEEGEQTEINYNPDNPEEVYIPAEKIERVVTIFTILSVGFFAAGFVAIGILVKVFWL